jgi:hypothetical protein
VSTSHLDVDDLADVLAGEPEPAHLAGCAACRARLDELAAAMPEVTQALLAAPLPPMPDDLLARIEERLAAARSEQSAEGDVLPMRARRNRWVPWASGAAAAAVLVVGGLLLTQGGGHSSGDRAITAAGAAGYKVNDTGTNYSKAALKGALPSLLSGTARHVAPEAAPQKLSEPAPTGTAADTTKAGSFGAVVADPLAELRTTTGLARCLNSLTDPSQTGLPLALDYASFEGKPALVVVLPSSTAGKVDVFVVPPGCAKADGSLLYFTRLPRP